MYQTAQDNAYCSILDGAAPTTDQELIVVECQPATPAGTELSYFPVTSGSQLPAACGQWVTETWSQISSFGLELFALLPFGLITLWLGFITLSLVSSCYKVVCPIPITSWALERKNFSFTSSQLEREFASEWVMLWVLSSFINYYLLLQSDIDEILDVLVGFLLLQWNTMAKQQVGSWRDGSVVKSTGCSSRGPEFKSQQTHGGSQPSVMRSDALFWCVWRQWQCAHRHKINKSKKQVGEERVYSAFASPVLFIVKGSQDKNPSRVGTWRRELCRDQGGVLLTGLFLLACSARFLREPRTTSPEMPPPTIGWALPHWSLIEKVPYSWILWWH